METYTNAKSLADALAACDGARLVTVIDGDVIARSDVHRHGGDEDWCWCETNAPATNDEVA